MNYRTKKAWIRHWNFILIDLFCLEVAFFVAYWIRHGMQNPFTQSIYYTEMLILMLCQILSAIFGDNFRNVLKRSPYEELWATVKQVILVTMCGVFYLFIGKHSESYSRMTMLLMGTFYMLFSYPARLALKSYLLKQYEFGEGKTSLLVITNTSRAEAVTQYVVEHLTKDYKVCGLVLTDAPDRDGFICGVNVVANMFNVHEYVCHRWVDAVYIDVEDKKEIPSKVLESFFEMGVTVHMKLQGIENKYHRKQYVEELAGSTVMTFSVNNISDEELFVKRIIDVIGGVVGCILTGILILVVGPIIYISSPGPIFYSQMRIGMNGKPFKIYKFRSMYMNADEIKKDLIKLNEMSDGMMFKMENDPRIIQGIGHFIRKTSIDEFPQFFNVMKGDMSLVGTRPPTLDEWEKYSLHHRLRMSIRPGITGLWQVSGRSDIKEFEEVVKLDAEYIAKWNIWLDIKIIWKTISVIWKGDGAR